MLWSLFSFPPSFFFPSLISHLISHNFWAAIVVVYNTTNSEITWTSWYQHQVPGNQRIFFVCGNCRATAFIVKIKHYSTEDILMNFNKRKNINFYSHFSTIANYCLIKFLKWSEGEKQINTRAQSVSALFMSYWTDLEDEVEWEFGPNDWMNGLSNFFLFS